MKRICPLLSIAFQHDTPCRGDGCMFCKGTPMRLICAIGGEKVEVDDESDTPDKCDRFFIDDGGQCSSPACWHKDRRDYEIFITCGGDKAKCCQSDQST